jgi:putative ATPase
MKNNAPLAERMRPLTLKQYIGQTHLVGEGNILERMVSNGQAHSMLFWGPPGVGKTTLARIIAINLGLHFFTLSAIDSGVKEVRSVIEQARLIGKAVLFIDEIHRFNKAQQDSLLGAVEKGIITLIGATTENPSFEVIHALLSRCQIYILKPLSEEELKSIVLQAIDSDEQLTKLNIHVEEWEALLALSGGDARKILNLLELVVNASDKDQIIISNDCVQQVVLQRSVHYDKSGEQHYDIISAFIKSMRGSDPNGAVYWLARMIEGGEDPKFIARRMLILASEDIGNANPNALLLATSCFQAVEMIGYPECRIILSQTAIYLACSAKSNSTYMAINNAQQLVKQTGDLPVPMHLRNAPTRLMKNLGYGQSYKYAHDFPNNFAYQEFLPDTILKTKLYEPGNNPLEDKSKNYLKQCWGDYYDY